MIYEVSKTKLKNSDLNNLINTIYINFYDLSKYPELKHSKKDITDLLLSDNIQVYFYIVKKKIAGYMIGDIMDLNDGRKVFYITYIFTAKQFRRNGIASKLLDYIQDKVNVYNLDGIMLTCNSENTKVYDFYLNKGFMPDLLLRRYTKYEILFK